MGPLILAHRGARSLAPENTLVAARMAAQIGAHGWEIDVRVTKDGELILMHDATLTRTTNVKEIFPNKAPWNVSDFTLAELRALDAGSWFVDTDPFGTIISGEIMRKQAEAYRGEKVPTLQEALVLSRELGLLVDIEIKALTCNFGVLEQERRIVEKVIQLIHELDIVEQTFVSSFSPGIVSLVKDLAPEIKTALLLETGMGLESLIETLRTLRVNAVNPDYRLFSTKELCLLNARGFEIYLWTVNDSLALDRLVRSVCVTGIITDWPQRALELLGR